MSKTLTAILIGAGNRGTKYTNIMEQLGDKYKVVAVAEPIDSRRNYIRETECLTQQDCEALIFDMARWSNSVLAIDGVEYLTSYNPLALISDKYERETAGFRICHQRTALSALSFCHQ